MEISRSDLFLQPHPISNIGAAVRNGLQRIHNISLYRSLMTVVLILALSATVSYLSAQNIVEKDAEQLLDKIRKSPADTSRVNMLFSLSKIYVYKKREYDTAIRYVREAYEIAEKLNEQAMLEAAVRLMVHCYIKKGNISQALDYFEQQMANARKKGEMEKIANGYARIAKTIPVTSAENIRIRMEYYDKAIVLAKKLKLFDLEMDSRSNVSYTLIIQGKMDLAERQYNEQLAYLQEHGQPSRFRGIYYGLSLISRARGDIGKELFYHLQILKQCDLMPNTLNNKQWKNKAYSDLVMPYNELKKYKESEEMSAKGLQLSMEIKDYDMYYYHVSALGNTLLIQNKNSEALAMALKAIKDAPPFNSHHQRVINGFIGKCYLRLNQTDKAEQYQLIADKYFNNIEAESRNADIVNSYKAVHYLNMAELYFVMKDYTKSKTYMDKYAQLGHDPVSIESRVKAKRLQTRIDTASGDFKAAYLHSTELALINDSVNNSKNKNAVADLMLKYETEKKDKDLIIGQQRINLLQKQALLQQNNLLKADLRIRLEQQQREQEKQLNLRDIEKREQDLSLSRFATEKKDTHIKLLNKQAELQTASLEKARLLRNTSLTGLTMMLVVLGLLYNGYRLKKKNNHQLTVQKQEIDNKNTHLQQLVVEKEWLLKEINHRVKNNLQIVMSLLNNQCFYMQDAQALLAIQESQHRVHSISLIHKKLYQGDNIGTIHMPDYISELVQYLKESFSPIHNIRFETLIEDIHLDVSQAVPLGLILNEAITNCFKYAFPQSMAGTILISLSKPSSERLRLEISDNGVGLPKDFKTSPIGSLGMSMMEGLTDDLGGHWQLESTAGTRIIIEFPYNIQLLKHQAPLVNGIQQPTT